MSILHGLTAPNASIPAISCIASEHQKGHLRLDAGSAELIDQLYKEIIVAALTRRQIRVLKPPR